jgi:hypothetical protein
MTASGANGAGAIPALVQDVAAQIIGDVLLARQVSGTLRTRSAQLRADSVKLRTPREVHSPHHHDDTIESRSPAPQRKNRTQS